MPRKQTRAASSAAAAAHTSNTPTFTSFAAATAHALPTFASTKPTPTTTPWDENALQILRRFSKRDTTTKQRALAELTTHLNNLPDSKPPPGQAFLAAWPSAFQTALEHDSPAVRSAALCTMSLIVNTFRRSVQPIFPDVLPGWIAATGDLNPSAADAASKSLREILHTPTHREKVAAKYASDFRQYVVDALSSLAPASFQTQASAALAVLSWLLDATNTSDSIAAIIDDNSNPIHVLVKGINKSSVNAAPGACALAIQTLSYMSLDNQADVARAKRFADVAALAIRNRESAGWDLAITLLRSGWHGVFEKSFSKLQNAVHVSVTAPLPNGLHALLPLFDALPPTLASSKFVMTVLNGMRDALNLLSASDDSRCSVSYSLVVLPAFLEAAHFAHAVAARRWLPHGRDELTQFEDAIFFDYIVPACRLFFAGFLPATPRAQVSMRAEGNATSRKGYEAPLKKPVIESASHIARTLRVLTHSRAKLALPCFAESFVDSIGKPNVAERLNRLTLVLRDTNELRFEQQFIYEILDKLLERETRSIANYSRAVAELLLLKACNVNLADESRYLQWKSLVQRVLRSATGMITELGNTTKLKGVDEYGKDIAEICSWVWWATAAFDIKNPLSEIMNALKLSCEPEVSYQILGLVGRAHRTHRDSNLTGSWHPIHGEEFDAILTEAMGAACSTKGCPQASFLVATAVEPSGGYAVSETVLISLAEKVINRIQLTMMDGALDEITELLLCSPLRFVSGDRADVFRNLTATSLLRATYVNSIMEAVLTHLGSVTIDEVARVGEIMIEVLEHNVFPLEDKETLALYATGIAKVVTLLGDRTLAASVSLCRRLMAVSSLRFASDFLKQAPFTHVFGNGEDVRIEMKYFTYLLERVYPERYDSFMEDLETFINNISVDERVNAVTEIMELFLSSGKMIPKHLLAGVITALTTDPQSHVSFRAISQNLEKRLVQKEGVVMDVGRIAHVVHLCALSTTRDNLHNFRGLLDEAVRIMRRDPSSAEAGVAVDILSASLAFTASSGDEMPIPVWLIDLVAICLRTARRHLEQSRKKESFLLPMEGLVGNLFCSVLEHFDGDNINADDLRFWTPRSLECLQSFVQRTDSVKTTDPQELARMVPIINLTLELIRAGKPEGSYQLPSLVDELTHWGSWAAVLLLPILGNQWNPESVSEQDSTKVSREAAAALILKAAERGTLFTPEGGVPVSAEYLHRLIPHLGSKSPLLRKAVLTVLTHGFAIELSGIASKSFPDSENEQVQLATEMIPQELQTALTWSHDRDDRLEQLGRDIDCYELGYFLAWRLFLDLIRADHAKTSKTDTAEDFSFRRVGFVYLRANPSVFANFFNKCVEVVVEGSASEQAAAGIAASLALEVEERAAQGIQLTQHESDESSGGNPTFSNECMSASTDIEQAVGHAAGIVFARALQRLPALSREHMMDRVDRGTFSRVENFVKKRVSPLLIAAEIRKVKEWGAFGGGGAQNGNGDFTEGEVNARGSIPGREVWATYTFSDVTLEIGMRLPDTFPLQSVEVEARSKVGMSEARWRKTLLGMSTLLRSKDGSLAEAVELWRQNLDKTFQGAEECPICYSVLHPSTAALPKMQCRTCKNLFHSDCLCKWFAKSNSSACPLCRSAF